jgi:hypothetical protein
LISRRCPPFSFAERKGLEKGARYTARSTQYILDTGITRVFLYGSSLLLLPLGYSREALSRCIYILTYLRLAWPRIPRGCIVGPEMLRGTWDCSNWQLVSWILTSHRIDLRRLGEIGDGKLGSGLYALVVIGAIMRKGSLSGDFISKHGGNYCKEGGHIGVPPCK